jgi:hypothetical protein
MTRGSTHRRALVVALALCAALAAPAGAQSCADSAGAFRRIIGEFQSRQRNVGLAAAVLASTWGIGSRSGELMSDAPDGLIGKLAAVCRGR